MNTQKEIIRRMEQIESSTTMQDRVLWVQLAIALQQHRIADALEALADTSTTLRKYSEGK